MLKHLSTHPAVNAQGPSPFQGCCRAQTWDLGGARRSLDTKEALLSNWESQRALGVTGNTW